jgi:hypothetical protein
MGRKKIPKYLKAKRKQKKTLATSQADTSQTTTPATVTRLTYEQSLRLVEITYDNKFHQLNINDQLDIVATTRDGMSKTSDASQSSATTAHNSSNFMSKRSVNIELPTVNVETCVDESHYVDYTLPVAYRQYNHKQEFDKHKIEYDMDEEDIEWLTLINLKRKNESLNKINYADFERIMDCLEKESFFQVCC